MKKLQQFFKKDLSVRAFWLGAALLCLVRIGLTNFQMFYTWVGGAPLDDELMFRAAGYISAGQWLGPYDYLTLSKNMFFAVWLALIHALHLPYLAAGQGLWCLAALAAVGAFAPVIRRRWHRFWLLAALVFLPSSIAAYTLRVYRDNIFPALCLLCFAGLCGAALRALNPQKKIWPWALVSGVGLACASLDREDGMAFLLPFVAVGAAIVLFLVVRSRQKIQKIGRVAALLLPFGVLAAGILTVCGLNYRYYGLFAISDFSEGSFAAAIGAMNRVQETERIDKVSIPAEVREMLYDSVPELEPLRYWLEEDAQMQNDFRSEKQGDYTCGSFYWAIRRAAQYEGVYESAQSAEQYWQTVADKINALCDSGALPAEGGKRVGTTPAIRAEHILPTILEGLHGFGFAATFQDCAPYETQRSIGTPDDLALWQGYLHDSANAAAEAGKDTPYYSPLQKLVYKALEGVRWVYAVCTPILLAGAAAVWLLAVKNSFGKGREQAGLLWLILAGLLASALLRCFMIAFVMVASFDIPTNTMYLASVHPLLVLFGGVVLFTEWEKRRKT